MAKELVKRECVPVLS